MAKVVTKIRLPSKSRLTRVRTAMSAKLFGSKPKLYWMGMGNTTIRFIISTVDLRNYWDSKGYKYEYVETEGGHIWRNWRIYLTMFAQKVFK